MDKETQKELTLLEEKNARIFQVMGSLKLLNHQVKPFVKRLEAISEEDAFACAALNESFQTMIHDVRFFKAEHKSLVKLGLHIPSVDQFAQNADRLFQKKAGEAYTILEMRRISVYIYRMADAMLTQLSAEKNANETRIHAIHAKNGKYYFNRK